MHTMRTDQDTCPSESIKSGHLGTECLPYNSKAY